MLQRSDGSAYVYHDGLKFAVQMATVRDSVIDAIALASPGQWVLFSGSATNDTPARAPLPEFCYWCAS